MIRELLDYLRRPAAPAQSAGYRAEAKLSRREVLFDLEAHLSAKQLRIRALEIQLRELGIEPAPTPDASDLLEVANVLDRAARGDITGLSCDHLRYLAAVIRGLGTWRE